MPNPIANLTAADRLSFTVFLALVIHALILLGLNFKEEDKPKPAPTLEITLAHIPSQKPKDKADFIADKSQEGSGSLDKKALPTTNQQALIPDNQVREITPLPQPVKAPPKPKKQQLLTSHKSSSRQVAKQHESEHKPKQTAQAEKLHESLDINAEIASLQAQFAQQRQAYAKRPRIHRVTAASTMQDIAAYYKDSWRRKVEKFGNLNYPEEARRKGLYGELRLLVAINSDGSLYEVSVLESSGQRVLDNAAIRIVKLAAPYAPFTGELARKVDRLELIRTWRFEKGYYLSSR